MIKEFNGEVKSSTDGKMSWVVPRESLATKNKLVVGDVARPPNGQSKICQSKICQSKMPTTLIY